MGFSGPTLLLLPSVLVAYACVAWLFAVGQVSRGRQWGLIPGIMLAFSVMHIAWGVGFWAGWLGR